MPTATAHRFGMLELLFLQASLQGPMFGQRMHFSFFAPEPIPYAIRRYEEQADIVDAVVERLLDGKPFFLGQEFSIVDITFFGWYLSAERAGFLAQGNTNLKAWFDRVKARPAVQKVIAAAPAIPLAGAENCRLNKKEGGAHQLLPLCSYSAVRPDGNRKPSCRGSSAACATGSGA